MNGPTKPDAELLMANFAEDVRAVHVHVAPERQSDLGKILGREIWEMDFTNQPANFAAYPDVHRIEVRYAALLSLWAVAKAALQISQAMAEATRQGDTVVTFELGRQNMKAVYCSTVPRRS
jgi:hypothetical protein